MTASTLKHDHDIIIIKSNESLKSSRKMNRNKKFADIILSMENKVFHAFSFELCSAANFKFMFKGAL